MFPNADKLEIKFCASQELMCVRIIRPISLPILLPLVWDGCSLRPCTSHKLPSDGWQWRCCHQLYFGKRGCRPQTQLEMFTVRLIALPRKDTALGSKMPACTIESNTGIFKTHMPSDVFSLLSLQLLGANNGRFWNPCYHPTW